MNLLNETFEALKSNGKEPKDVKWVAAKNGFGSWDDFVALANFDYNKGYGRNEIDLTLKVVGDGWWLERGEYDGSEWWNFQSPPIEPEKSRPLWLEDIMER